MAEHALPIEAFTLSTGERLRKAREHVGLTQGEIALRLRIDRKTVNNYEHGRTPVPVAYFYALAEITGYPRQWLEAGEVPVLGDPPAVEIVTPKRSRQGGKGQSSTPCAWMVAPRRWALAA